MNFDRWILIEAWMMLGLRIEWASAYFDDSMPDDWFEDVNGVKFMYVGHGVWNVKRHGFRRQDWESPDLSVEVLAHELAHYLAATEEEREQRNFGLSVDHESPQVAHADKIITMMLRTTNRIANLASGGGTR